MLAELKDVLLVTTSSVNPPTPFGICKYRLKKPQSRNGIFVVVNRIQICLSSTDDCSYFVLIHRWRSRGMLNLPLNCPGVYAVGIPVPPSKATSCGITSNLIAIWKEVGFWVTSVPPAQAATSCWLMRRRTRVELLSTPSYCCHGNDRDP